MEKYYMPSIDEHYIRLVNRVSKDFSTHKIFFTESFLQKSGNPSKAHE